ncbi:MAG: glycerate kinase [Solirubrobacterales bacterium]
MTATAGPVLVAPDKFKGTLSGAEVAVAIAAGLRRAGVGEVDEVPLADGGEGTAAALLAVAGGRTVQVPAHDALGREVMGRVAILGDGVRAVVEAAEASGLWRLAPDELDAEGASSRGTGELIAAALANGAREVLVAVGGTASTDGGKGALEALGARSEGRVPEPGGTAVPAVTTAPVGDAASAEATAPAGEPASAEATAPVGEPASAEATAPVGEPASAEATAPAGEPAPGETTAPAGLHGLHQTLGGARLIVLADVNAPMCGPSGAARVFGPQKGADDAAVRRLEGRLEAWAGRARGTTGRDPAGHPGAGAGGGLAGGLWAFAGAEIRPGAAFVLDAAGFDRRLSRARAVVTGEGRLDAQTLSGKVVAAVAERARAAGVRCVAVVGESRLSASQASRLGLDVVEAAPGRTATAADLSDAAARLAASLRG